MKNNILKIGSEVLVLLGLLATTSCTPTTQATSQQEGWTTDSLQYAQNFRIEHKGDSVRLTVLNPWKENVLIGQYSFEKECTPIATTSSAHVGYIDALGQVSQIAAAASPNLVYSPSFQEQYAQNTILNLGDAYTLNYEHIIHLQPAALLMTGYNQVDKQAERLKKAGINVITTVEWTEKNILGRAEWIKFFGALVGKSEQADSIFNEVVKAYTALQTKVAQAQEGPSVFSGLPFKGTWYMPGGQSFMGNLLRNAGANYYYATNNETGSMALSFENVWYHFKKADLWIGVDADSIAELKAIDKRLLDFEAVEKGQVYHYRNRISATGANDFWESAMVRPDWLLSDLIHLFHPELLPNWDFVYIGKLP